MFEINNSKPALNSMLAERFEQSTTIEAFSLEREVGTRQLNYKKISLTKNERKSVVEFNKVRVNAAFG